MLWPVWATANDLRVSTYTLDFSRKGPGLLLRDILNGDDPQILSAARVIAHAQADILLLVGLDFDLGGATLSAFAQLIVEQGGPVYPHQFSRRPNTGLPTGFDLDRNGHLGDPRDAQGYGRYGGQNGLAILSKHPIDVENIHDFSAFLWADLPDATLPQHESHPYFTRSETDILRLSSTAHWDIPILLPQSRSLSLLAFAATPPVFDGPEDRNGLRNADEVRFWSLYLDGKLPVAPPDHPVIIIGKANLDPIDGEGRRGTIATLLARPDLQDPAPHKTAHFPAPPDGPGDLRVDYLLPDRRLDVTGAGVDWPTPDDPRLDDVERASRHRLIWVDLDLRH